MDAYQWHRHCLEVEPVEPARTTKQQWARLSDQELEERRGELRRWIRTLNIGTPELESIDSTLTAVVDANSESPPGAKQLIAVTGPNALGKSTLVKRWAR